MTVLPLVVLVLAAPSRPPRDRDRTEKVVKVEGSRLEQGQRLFAEGDFEGALRALDAAAEEGGPAEKLEQVHLLRARCFAARQQFVQAEEAFARALDANPDTELDPASVDPTVVKLLEAVRARLTGTLVVSSTPAGATLFLDGVAAGVTPRTLEVPVGKHRLEARWGEGALTATEVQLRPRREVRVEWVKGPVETVTVPEPPPVRTVSPYGDFRFAPEFSATPMVSPTLPLELGGGVEFKYVRLGLGVRLYPFLGLTPRFTFALPVLPALTLALELGVPVGFTSTVLLGLSGGLGVELYPVKFFGLFAMVGGRHLFIRPGNDATAFTASAGVRLRLP